ncbi:hypothetical protein MRY87_10480 [bacterium]|nr:hypothetical protein [bacterium]
MDAKVDVVGGMRWKVAHFPGDLARKIFKRLRPEPEDCDRASGVTAQLKEVSFSTVRDIAPEELEFQERHLEQCRSCRIQDLSERRESQSDMAFSALFTGFGFHQVDLKGKVVKVR